MKVERRFKRTVINTDHMVKIFSSVESFKHYPDYQYFSYELTFNGVSASDKLTKKHVERERNLEEKQSKKPHRILIRLQLNISLSRYSQN